MAAKASAKGILKVLKADASDFPAQFEKLVSRRHEEERRRREAGEEDHQSRPRRRRRGTSRVHPQVRRRQVRFGGRPRGHQRRARRGRRGHRRRRSCGARQSGDAGARVPPQADRIELGSARRRRGDVRPAGPPHAPRRHLRAGRNRHVPVERHHERGAGFGRRSPRDHHGGRRPRRTDRSDPKCCWPRRSPVCTASSRWAGRTRFRRWPTGPRRFPPC